MKPVGILGGMGPEATLLLMRKVLQAVHAVDDADHVPLIVHQNPAVPSRIAALIEGTGADPAPVLAQMARDLRAAGAVALAMPCNTAHYYAASVDAATDLPFLNMPDLTAQHLADAGARRVGMLASPAVRLTGVFAAAFSAHGLTQVYPQDDAPVLAMIRSVKAGRKLEHDVLAAPCAMLRQQGADHILVACSELSLYSSGIGDQIAWADSLDCLTKAIVAASGSTA